MLPRLTLPVKHNPACKPRSKPGPLPLPSALARRRLGRTESADCRRRIANVGQTAGQGPAQTLSPHDGYAVLLLNQPFGHPRANPDTRLAAGHEHLEEPEFILEG